MELDLRNMDIKKMNKSFGQNGMGICHAGGGGGA